VRQRMRLAGRIMQLHPKRIHPRIPDCHQLPPLKFSNPQAPCAIRAPNSTEPQPCVAEIKIIPQLAGQSSAHKPKSNVTCASLQSLPQQWATLPINTETAYRLVTHFIPHHFLFPLKSICIFSFPFCFQLGNRIVILKILSVSISL
jgi:hypothetical protein